VPFSYNNLKNGYTLYVEYNEDGKAIAAFNMNISKTVTTSDPAIATVTPTTAYKNRTLTATVTPVAGKQINVTAPAGFTVTNNGDGTFTVTGNVTNDVVISVTQVKQTAASLATLKVGSTDITPLTSATLTGTTLAGPAANLSQSEAINAVYTKKATDSSNATVTYAIVSSLDIKDATFASTNGTIAIPADVNAHYLVLKVVSEDAATTNYYVVGLNANT